jgi:cellulose synthase/poly-beta-1,6-N-acetylglucosamine synthase-like glycosyltransferase
MISIGSVLAVVFWLSVLVVAYAYLGYPLAVWVLARLFGHLPNPPADSELPSVTMLISAFNEEKVIGRRLQNITEIDYPADKLQVLIISDGSSDRTGEIVRSFENGSIRLLDYRERRGKPAALNAALKEVTGEILTLSDANTFTNPDALRRMVRWFSDPTVGAVAGRVLLQDPVSGRNVDGLYWRYETFIKGCEGRLGALVGANGPIYAIRRSLFRVSSDSIVDDFTIPLTMQLRTWARLVFDPEAIATEEAPAEISDEFKRRARIGAGGYQSLPLLWPLLDPRRGWLAFTFFSHKVVRWLCPIFICLALITNLGLVGAPLYQAALGAQLLFYAIALAGFAVTGPSLVARLLRLASMFASMNLALLVGLARWFTRQQSSAWERTAR